MEVLGVATTLSEGAKLAEEHKPDVVLLDMVLPDGRGVDLGKHILANLPDSKVLALTALNDPKVMGEVLRAGFHGFLTKTAPLSHLVESISASASGRAVVPHRHLQRAAGAKTPEEENATLRASQLTDREKEVLALLCEGASGEEMAEQLSVSKNTVRTHVQNILMKLQVHSRLEAVAFAVRHGVVQIPRKSGLNGA